MDRGNDKISVRFSPEIHYKLDKQAAQARKTKTEIVREAVEQHLFGDEWLSKCDAVLRTSINQVEESHRALEARIHRLVDEGAIDFEIQTVNAEISKSEERMKEYIRAQLIQTFTYAMEKIPSFVIQLHERQSKESMDAMEERMKSYFETKFKIAFGNMLRKLPEAIVQIHEHQKSQK